MVPIASHLLFSQWVVVQLSHFALSASMANPARFITSSIILTLPELAAYETTQSSFVSVSTLLGFSQIIRKII
jgi:hypothetical protein